MQRTYSALDRRKLLSDIFGGAQGDATQRPRSRTEAMPHNSRATGETHEDGHQHIGPMALCALCGHRYAASFSAEDAESRWREHTASEVHQRHVKRWLGSVPLPQPQMSEPVSPTSAHSAAQYVFPDHDASLLSVLSEAPSPAPPLRVTLHPRVPSTTSNDGGPPMTPTLQERNSAQAAAPPSIDRSEMVPGPQLDVDGSPPRAPFLSNLSTPLVQRVDRPPNDRYPGVVRCHSSATQTDWEEGAHSPPSAWTEEQALRVTALFQERCQTRRVLSCFIRWHRRWFVAELQKVTRKEHPAAVGPTLYFHRANAQSSPAEEEGPTRLPEPEEHSHRADFHQEQQQQPGEAITPAKLPTRRKDRAQSNDSDDSVDGLLSLLTPETQQRAARVLGRASPRADKKLHLKTREPPMTRDTLKHRPLHLSHVHTGSTARSSRANDVYDEEELMLKGLVRQLLHEDLNHWRGAKRDDLYAAASRVAVKALESVAIIREIRASAGEGDAHSKRKKML